MKKVFIIGAHRSGTTKLASYFSEVLGFAGAAESHIFRLVASLMDGKGEIQKTIPRGAYEVNKIGFDAIFDALIITLDRLVSDHHKGKDFFDKTPGFRMIRATPLIARSIPEAKFIYMHRHGIANVNSNLRLWPDRHFSDACQMWARPITAYHEVKQALGDRLISFAMNDMIMDPWSMHTRISNHIGLQNIWSQDEIEDYFNSPSQSSTVKSKPSVENPTLDEQTWTCEEKEIFEQICGSQMRLMGYEY